MASCRFAALRESGHCEKRQSMSLLRDAGAQGISSACAAAGAFIVVGYPSGQRGQTVNLLAYAFTGSNPVPTTIFLLPRFVFPAFTSKSALFQMVRSNFKATGE